MSQHYDDAALEAAMTAVREHGEWSEKWTPEAPRCIAGDVLEAVAPLIAAKALRDAAEATREHTTITNDGRRIKSERPVWGIGERQLLHRRAAEIERGRS